MITFSRILEKVRMRVAVSASSVVSCREADSSEIFPALSEISVLAAARVLLRLAIVSELAFTRVAISSFSLKRSVKAS